MVARELLSLDTKQMEMLDTKVKQTNISLILKKLVRDDRQAHALSHL